MNRFHNMICEYEKAIKNLLNKAESLNEELYGKRECDKKSIKTRIAVLEDEAYSMYDALNMMKKYNS